MIQNTEFEKVEKLNPFFSIWLSPRETIRYVLDFKDLKYALILAVIAGMTSAISGSKGYDFSMGFILAFIFVLGPIFQLIALYIGAAIFTWVGKWFDGYGTFDDMVKAMGVCCIPNIWLTPFWILSFIIGQNNLFAFNDMDITAGALIWFLVSNFISIAYSIWIIVIQSKAIGEVHQFSSWKGFATFIIPALVIGVILFFLVLIIVFIFSL